MSEAEVAARLDALLAARGQASATDLRVSPADLLDLGRARRDVEGIFLVRFRSRVGGVRVEEIRADAWPARRVAAQDEGYFAEASHFVRLELRREVPFPLRLFAEPSQVRDVVDRVRRASRVFVRAAALVLSRPRRAEQAFRALEPLFEAISADAAGAMWIEVTRIFADLGDLERASRASSRLAALGRRASVSASLLARAALDGARADGWITAPDLVDVAAEKLSPLDGLGLRLGILRRQIEAGRAVPSGTMAAIEHLAKALPDAAEAEDRVDAAILGMIRLAQLWTAAGEATLVRARLASLWRSGRARSLRDELALMLRADRAALDAEGLSCLLGTLLPASWESDAPLLLGITLRLLQALPKGRTEHAEDTAYQGLRSLAKTNPALLDQQAADISASLALAFADPLAKPLGEAILADLKAPSPASFSRFDLERALLRWLPEPLRASIRAAILGQTVSPALETLASGGPSAFVLALRLVALAQDERTDAVIAERALSLAQSFADRLDLSEPLSPDLDPALSLPRAETRALREGIILTRSHLFSRDLFRPERWPAPSIPGLSEPRDARFVLLTYVLGHLETREAHSHHLAFTRIASGTPLVRAGLGRLVPQTHALRRGPASTLARLASAALARISTSPEPSLRDVVLLCAPLELAEAFALDAHLPRVFAPADKPPAEPASAPPRPRARPLPAPDLEPARSLFAEELDRAPFPVPARDPALPLAPEIAGYVLCLDARGDISVLGARGAPLRRVPSRVRNDEAYRALLRGKHAERVRKREAALDLEARMTSALEIDAEDLAFLLEDPLYASLFRGLVVNVPALDRRGLFWSWDRSRGLGVVPLDYDATWLGHVALEIVHPARLADLAAWRDLASELGARQRIPQLTRDLRSVPEEERNLVKSRSLAGRSVDSARALFHALRLEGFEVSATEAKKAFVHADIDHRLDLSFELGEAQGGDEGVISGCFGFSARGAPLRFVDVPTPILCEARSSLERALARAARRAR